MEVNIVQHLIRKGFRESEIVRGIKVIAQMTQFAEQNGLSMEEVISDLKTFANRNLAHDKDVGSLSTKMMAAYWSSFQAGGVTDVNQWEPTELEQLIQTIDDPFVRVMLGVIYETGMRGSQLLALTGNDVDCSNNTIRIKRHGEYVTLVISGALSSQLEQYVRFIGAPPESPLFALCFSGKRNLKAVDNLMRTAARKLGWQRPISIAVLRKCYLARALEK